MVFHQIVDKSKSASLAAQRTVTDAGKVGIAVEAVAFEDCHHSLVFHLAVFYDSLEDDSAVGVHVLQAIPGDGPQELCHGEHGTRVEPAANVVAADVVKERFCRNGKKNVLKLFEIFYAGNLFQRVRVAENKVPETEIVRYDTTQVDVHLFGILVDEGCIVFGCICHVVRFTGLYDKGYKWVFLADGGAELDTGQSVLFAPFHAGEAYVSDDT